MDVLRLIKYYEQIFDNPKDILDWIEHDFRHMGLEQSEMDVHMNEARKILGV